MPDDTTFSSLNTRSEPENTQGQKTLPPIGDVSKAEKYIDRLIELMNKDKCQVTQSDLAKFGQSHMKEHYRISLGTYDAEVSHSLNQNQRDTYILLFTNTQQIKEGKAQDAILAYINLSSELYGELKTSIENHIERKIKEAEEKRFNEAMQPIDDLIDQALRDDSIESETPTLIQEEITQPRPQDLNGPFSMFKSEDTQPNQSDRVS